jgi:hypothetical protein
MTAKMLAVGSFVTGVATKTLKKVLLVVTLAAFVAATIATLITLGVYNMFN